jgi:tetratricopeptide (TPR) repeat protein
LIWPWTFTFYLRQFFFPHISVPLHRLAKPVLLTNPEYFLSLAVVALVVLALVRLRRNKWFVFAVLFYFLSIFFLLRFDETKDVNTVADRFMYLPSLGFCLLLGLGVERLWMKCRGKNLARPVGSLREGMIVTGLVVLAAAFSFKTFHQSFVWRDSITLWRHQLKYFPRERIALNNLATALGKTKEFKDAQKEYRRIMGAGLNEIQKGLSPQAVASVRKVDSLISLYQRGIQSAPDFKDARYNLGNLYAALGRFPESVEAYKEALNIDPNFKDAHCGLGDVYLEIGDQRQAVFAYEQALRLNPEDKDLHAYIVKAYTKAIAKNPEAAAYRQARSGVLARYAAMVNKDRPKATSYLSLGNLYVETGDNAMALLAYQRALEINPRHSGVLYNLGNLYKEQGRLKEALGFYQKALEINPRMSDIYLNMGVIYGRQGEKDREKFFYQKALEADPRSGRAYFNLGFLEEAAENLPVALELYQKSVDLDPANAEGYYNMGNIYARLKRDDEAISSYLKAVEQDPRHTNALVNLSILSFQKGDFAAAVKYCDEAVLSGYDAPEGYLNALAPHRQPAGGN